MSDVSGRMIDVGNVNPVSGVVNLLLAAGLVKL
jgi:hypothetical protein